MQTEQKNEIRLRWQPAIRYDGRSELLVDCFNPETGRASLCSLTLHQYLAAWNDRLLAFQKEGTTKPDHLPMPEDVLAYLEHKQQSVCVAPQSKDKYRATLADIVANTIDGGTRRSAEAIVPVPRPQSVFLTRPALLMAPVAQKQSVALPSVKATQEPSVYENRRRKYSNTIEVLEQCVHDLRQNRCEELCASGQTVSVDMVQLDAREVFEAAAKVSRMTPKGVATVFYRKIPKETQIAWLIGINTVKQTRSEIKFSILLQVRDEFRKLGCEAPRKKELIESAAKLLGMTLASTATYIYDRLTEKQVTQLDLRLPPRTRVEQIAILKHVRNRMRLENRPAPRIIDLARAAVPLLEQKFSSIRTLISSLDESIKKELDLVEFDDVFFATNPEVVRQGLLGALAVLNLRKKELTVHNLRMVLQVPLVALEAYLARHKDIAALLGTSKKLKTASE